ncbi:glycosyltransferase family 4 protein [Rathayibacter sp. CAU 1779]
MRILIASWSFAPSVGGVETTADLLARHFITRGHQVVLATAIGQDDHTARPYPVIRRPSPWRLAHLVFTTDVVFHNAMSLKMAWPLFFIRRPWVVAVRLFFDEEPSARAQIRHVAHKYARLVANSAATADDLPFPATVVRNGVRTDVFHASIPPESRDPWRIVGAGRLVDVKGFDMLIEAFALLRRETGRGDLTLVGQGPALSSLRLLAEQRGVGDHVRFVGALSQHELAQELNQNAVAVIPSRWRETFGNVALEAIASGCAVITTAGGGLPEAVGECGLVIPEPSVADLFDAMRDVVGNRERILELRSGAEKHVASLSSTAMGDGYLAVLVDEYARNNPVPSRRARYSSRRHDAATRTRHRQRS